MADPLSQNILSRAEKDPLFAISAKKGYSKTRKAIPNLADSTMIAGFQPEFQVVAEPVTRSAGVVHKAEGVLPECERIACGHEAHQLTLTPGEEVVRRVGGQPPYAPR